MEEEILVSIYCASYNHEEYIKDALEGFVSQRTNFKYEVFVHDDASTDNTRAIIKEYVDRYPTIFRTVFQEENQYSKDVKIFHTFILNRMKGKYVAFCDGDDYWCNFNKLQLEVDFLERHKDYSACTHNTVMLNCCNGKIKKMFQDKEDVTLKLQDIVKSGSSCFHSSSLMFRKELAEMPSVFTMKNVSDYPRAIYLGMKGKIYYFKDSMSVYRIFSTKCSWSCQNSVNSEKRVSILSLSNEMLNNINKYTNYEYDEVLNNAIRENEFIILREQHKYKKIMKEYPELFQKCKISTKIKMKICSLILFGGYPI